MAIPEPTVTPLCAYVLLSLEYYQAYYCEVTSNVPENTSGEVLYPLGVRSTAVLAPLLQSAHGALTISGMALPPLSPAEPETTP